MAKNLPVVIYPHETLRKKAAVVDNFDKDLSQLAEDLVSTMYEYRGIGLAANQVNVLKRIFVLDVSWRDSEEEKKPKKSPEIYVNPVILAREGEVEYEEGCLSVPKMYAMLQRSEIIQVKFHDLKGIVHEATFSDLRAIAFQHELDHLDGVMFFDHISSFKRRILLEKFSKLQLELKKEEE